MAQNSENSSHLFIKVTISELMHPKDGFRQSEEYLKCCENAIFHLEQLNHEGNFYEVVFRPFMLACSGSHKPSILVALDCLAKLFGYKFWNNTNKNAGQATDGLVGLIIETIANCFAGEHTDEKIQLQVVKAMTAAISVDELEVAIHGTLLLKAVRIMYNIFLLSKSTNAQTVAQAAITHCSSTIFNRIPNTFIFEKIMEPHRKKENIAPTRRSLNEFSRSMNENDNNEDPFGMGEIVQRDPNTRLSQDILLDESDAKRENLNDQITKDAYLLFRAFCKLSMKTISGPDSAIDLKAPAMRSKILSLHLIRMIMKDHPAVFNYPSPSLFSCDLKTATASDLLFIHAVRQYICIVFTRNIVSIVPQVFDVSMDIFARMLLDLRSLMKKEISIMFTRIIIPMIEASIPTTYYQRVSCTKALLRALTHHDGGKVLVEFYLNYDCDENSGADENIFERLVISICQVITNNTVELLEQHNFDFSHSSKELPAVTTGNLKNYTRDQVRQLYLPTTDSTELKMKMLDLLVRGALFSLSLWTSGDTNSPEKKLSIPENDVDDPDSFEMSKNKKARLAEGIKLFNLKPTKALRLLVNGRVIPSNQPRHIAHFLFNCPGLDKKMIGDYLGEGDAHNIATMHAFVDYMDLSNKTFVEALRMFLSKFQLPGEAQKIDRFMLKFAERYLQGNPSAFSTADTAYVLAYSVIMLNTDLYNSQVKKKMTREQFIKNNSGIDEGNKDLSVQFLTSIYDEITANELKMNYLTNSEAQNTVDPQVEHTNNGKLKTKGPVKYYKNSSIQEVIKQNKGSTLDPTFLDRQFDTSGSTSFVEAHHRQHVKPMFQLVWMSTLMSLTSFFQNNNEIEGIINALEGFKHCMHICCTFNLGLELNAFFSNLSKFVELPSLTEIKEKNVEACKTLLEIALIDGNAFGQSHWSVFVKCISQLEYHHSRGMIEPDESRNAEQRKADATHIEKIFYQISSQAVTLSVDRIFTKSIKLEANSITAFAKALCSMSWDEIISSSSKEHPRMYCLQRLLELAHYNLNSRIRIEWNQIWAAIGPHFNQVGCHSNQNVVYFCLDKYRQLTTKFLEIEELANFKFQKEFLKPFLFIFENNPSPKIKDMVLSCVNHMILYKAVKLRSGWKLVFAILSAASGEKSENIVSLGFKMTATINSEFVEFVIAQNAYSDLVATLSRYCNIVKFPDISSNASNLLKQGANKFSIQPTKRDAPPDNDDSGTKIWLITLRNLKDVILSGELEVRNRTLSDLFELLISNGQSYSNSLWMQIFDEIVLPLFSEIKRAPQVNSSQAKFDETNDLFVSTTLVSALKNLVALYSTFPVLLNIALEPILELLSFCVIQENDTWAKLGSACIQDFIENNAGRFDIDMWDAVCQMLQQLFTVTSPSELFCEVELNENEIQIEAPWKMKLHSPPTRKQFPKIILKCILHLIVIQTVHKLLTGAKKDLILESLHRRHIFILSEALYKSFFFAKSFNECMQLRKYLLNIGFMRTLPNLVKQETTASAAYLILLSSIYKDTSTKRTSVSAEIEGHLFPLAYAILNQFCEFDPETQSGNIAAWEPVISVIVNSFSEFPDTRFSGMHGYFYKFFVRILAMKIESTMPAMAIIFEKIGSIHAIVKTSPPFSTGFDLHDSHESLVNSLTSLEEISDQQFDLIAAELVSESLRSTTELLEMEINGEAKEEVDPFPSEK